MTTALSQQLFPKGGAYIPAVTALDDPLTITVVYTPDPFYSVTAVFDHFSALDDESDEPLTSRHPCLNCGHVIRVQNNRGYCRTGCYLNGAPAIYAIDVYGAVTRLERDVS